MQHLVLTVSPESSIPLLRQHADLLLLDKDPLPARLPFYNSLYIRSHFASPKTVPQVFTTQIDAIVAMAKRANPDVKIIDGMDSVEKIVAFEDKWNQYTLFKTFMPRTEVLTDYKNTAFLKPIFKKRLSSRGTGVQWDQPTESPDEDWIVQESIEIREEVRMYTIRGTVYPTGAIRRSQTEVKSAGAVASRKLTPDEIVFAESIAAAAPTLDILGLDVARSTDGRLYVLEANRSPGFGAFATLTAVNLADELYSLDF